MGELDGKTALVTGGSRGVGRAVALGLAAQGALVAVHYGSNDAGIHSVSSIGQLTEDEFARLLAVNVSTPLFVIQRALPLLRDGGRIVNMDSAATRIADPGQLGYTVTKAAPASLAPSLANELGRRGITVNTVETGVVLTESLSTRSNPARC